MPVTPRNEAPRPAASKPPVNREPASTARVAPPLSPPLSQTLSQTPPEVVEVPAPPPIVPVAPPVAELPPVSSPAPSGAPPPPAAAPARAAASAIESNTRGSKTRWRAIGERSDAGRRRCGRSGRRSTRETRRGLRATGRSRTSLFDGCKIDLNNDTRAEATCKGRARYVPRVGSREPSRSAAVEVQPGQGPRRMADRRRGRTLKSPRSPHLSVVWLDEPQIHQRADIRDGRPRAATCWRKRLRGISRVRDRPAVRARARMM